nr:MAG TPA: SIR2 family protein [Caudoviricetes sp.]
MAVSTDQHAENLYGEERRLIQRAEREKRLVFFVGAGVSVPSGMPLWSTAISEIKTRMKGDLQDDALKIPQYYYIQHGE